MLSIEVIFARTLRLRWLKRGPLAVTAAMPREKLMDQTIALLLKRLDGIRFRRVALGLFWIVAAPACKFDQTWTTNVSPPPPTVTISSSEQSQIIDWEIATARVEAIEAVEVRPRVSGHLTEVHFAAGQIVRKGDVLFVIDRRWYKAELDRTTAEVLRAEAALESLKTEV